MSVVGTNRIALVSSRGAAVAPGAATVTGSTARGGRDLVDLTLRRTSENATTLTGTITNDGSGSTALTMTRKGKTIEVVGTIGWEPMWKPVALSITTQSFGRSSMTGKICGRDVNLTLERAQGVTTVTGKIGVYEDPAIGTTRITITEANGARTYEGSTSKQSQGSVKLTQTSDGTTVKTEGKLGGWDVTELAQPASMRDLELVDTTLLIVLAQAVRRYIRNI